MLGSEIDRKAGEGQKQWCCRLGKECNGMEKVSGKEIFLF